MAQPPEPVTRSPGKLGLIYHDAHNLEHRCSLNLVTGTPLTPTELEPLADEMANAIAPILAVGAHVDSYFLKTPDGGGDFQAALPVIVNGTGTTAPGQDWYSYTNTFTGRGNAAGVKDGQARFEIFTNGAQAIAHPGVKSFPIQAPPDPYGIILVLLNGGIAIGADFYGNPCTWRPAVQVQFNAHYQRKYGC